LCVNFQVSFFKMVEETYVCVMWLCISNGGEIRYFNPQVEDR